MQGIGSIYVPRLLSLLKVGCVFFKPMSSAVRKSVAILSVIGLAVSAIALIPAGVSHGEAAGDGSELNPFRIGSAEDLRRIGTGDMTLDKHYVQTSDILFTEDDSLKLSVSIVKGELTTDIEVNTVARMQFRVILLLNEFIATSDGGENKIKFTVSNSLFLDETQISIFYTGTIGLAEVDAANAWIISFKYYGTETFSSSFPIKGNFLPIGNKENPFTGKYDGMGFKIGGLKVIDYKSGDSVAGLFGYISGATIRNVSIDGGNSIFSSNSFFQTPSKIYSAYDAVTRNSAVASICAYAHNSFIENCNSDAIVISGMIDIKKVEIVSNGLFHLNTLHFESYIGGIIGYAENSVIKASSFTGTGSSLFFNEKELIFSLPELLDPMTNSFSMKISQTGRSSLGGIVGLCKNSTVTLSKNDSDLIGGVWFVSKNIFGEEGIPYDYLFGEATFVCARGGIVGLSEGSTKIITCLNTGDLLGEEFLVYDHTGYGMAFNRLYYSYQNSGGILGMLCGNSEITNCLNTGQIERTTHVDYPSRFLYPDYCIGGIVGYIVDSTIYLKNCFSDSKPPYKKSGGLIGFSDKSEPTFRSTFFVSQLNAISNKTLVEDSKKTMIWTQDTSFYEKTNKDWDYAKTWTINGDNKPQIYLRYNVKFEKTPLMSKIRVGVLSESNDLLYEIKEPAMYFRMDPKITEGHYLRFQNGSEGYTFLKSFDRFYISTDVDESGSPKDIFLTATEYKINLNVTYQIENVHLEEQIATMRSTETLSSKLIPTEGYVLPAEIEVLHGKTKLDKNSYSFDPVSGVITIPNVREDIVIRAIGTINDDSKDIKPFFQDIVDLLYSNRVIITQSTIFVMGFVVSAYGFWTLRD